MEIACDIIKDLYPVYSDGCASAQTRKVVREHLNGCKNCRTFIREISVAERADKKFIPKTPDFSRIVKKARQRAAGILGMAAVCAGAVLCACLLVRKDSKNAQTKVCRPCPKTSIPRNILYLDIKKSK